MTPCIWLQGVRPEKQRSATWSLIKGGPMEKERWSRGIAAVLLCLAFTYIIIDTAGGTGIGWGYRE